MDTDYVLILEDDKTQFENFKKFFIRKKINLEPRHCPNYDEYSAVMGDDTLKNKIKCVIMDLSNSRAEEETMSFKSTELIREQYNKNRIPIFIHSGYLENYEDFDNHGTVIRKEKTNTSAEEITDAIHLMQESGFLNIFSTGGTLEEKIMSEIHNAFVNQFKANEIQAIIKSIKKASPDSLQLRTQEVFERIALRALYQNTVSNTENDQSVKVNSIEHFYRRTSLDSKLYWTGDLFVNRKDVNDICFIATPRCDLANSKLKTLLICKVINLKTDEEINPDKSKAEEKLKKLITDNRTEERYRFLPKTPQFKGGIVDFVETHTMIPDVFSKDYSYLISTVDDLTNDVVRKLATYLLRGGISDTAYPEALYYFQKQENDNTGD